MARHFLFLVTENEKLQMINILDENQYKTEYMDYHVVPEHRSPVS